MSARDIVVIGASAGGVEALISILGALPRGLGAAIFITIHRREGARDSLAHALRPHSKLPLHTPRDGERLRRGVCYVCGPDAHLMVERGRVRNEPSPREYLHRPSIDALFRSAAQAYGRRVVGVVLSGMLADGTAGLWQIKKHGGIAIVQDPTEASYDRMPRSALDAVAVDHVLRVGEIAAKLAELAAGERFAAPGARKARVLVVEDERIVAKNIERRLVELGYEVAGSAASGEEVLALAERTQPDVVLMDIHLAGTVDGTEAARRVWQRLQIPVVYVTAYADADTLDEAKTTEPYGYVVKPFRPEQVHAAIQLALERRARESGD